MQNFFDNEATAAALHATMKPARGGKCLVTFSTYEDRKEALLNTTIMDDAGTYRSSGAKTTAAQQLPTDKQQSDQVDSRATKQEAQNHIPKPPPPQPLPTQPPTRTTVTNAVNNNRKAVPSNDSVSGQRLSNSSPNANALNGNKDTYSTPNKTPATCNGTNLNRQCLRLGTVTIGEYRQQSLRREPEKFNFISAHKQGRETGDATPPNEALQNELQNTLSRANLRQSVGNPYTEHQRNCPLHQQQQQQQQLQLQLQKRPSADHGTNGYALQDISKKLQKSSLNESHAPQELLTKTNNRSVNNGTGATGVGILKNGHRNGTSNKSTEKSIKFG